MDHMEHVLASLDMFEAVAENLINFTFNVRVKMVSMSDQHSYFLARRYPVI
jgi:hypothetical protein